MDCALHFFQMPENFLVSILCCAIFTFFFFLYVWSNTPCGWERLSTQPKCKRLYCWCDLNVFRFLHFRKCRIVDFYFSLQHPQSHFTRTYMFIVLFLPVGYHEAIIYHFVRFWIWVLNFLYPVHTYTQTDCFYLSFFNFQKESGTQRLTLFFL